MSFIEIVLLALGLSFDTFAVSLAAGVCMPQLSWGKRLRIACVMALFQGGLTVLGWLLGSEVSGYIARWDHWVAFLLLGLIGGKMMYEGLQRKGETEDVNLLSFKTLCVVAIATSIDALMVGVSLAMVQLPWERIALAGIVIALITALAALTGLWGGRRLGQGLGKKAEIVGGLVLILLGVKLLIEHV